MLQLRKQVTTYELNIEAFSILLNAYASEVWKELVEKHTLYFNVKHREDNKILIKYSTNDFDDVEPLDTDKFKTDEELIEYLKGFVRNLMKEIYEDWEPATSELFVQGSGKFS